MIVSGGENVFPKEVEDCLAAPRGGRGRRRDRRRRRRLRQAAQAFVVAARRRRLDEDELKGWVKDNLARYKVPRDIVFLDELPRNATGKVLKRDLKVRADRRPGRTRDGPSAAGAKMAHMTDSSIGGPAPDFTLRDQHGQDVTLSSYRGKQGRRDRLLPVRLHRCLHRRDGGHPRPARRTS